ncbi:MAG: peptidoglycan DD-metalloendopeptidase family protein [Tidjanibacter sp.]|nr:peptidoglycan DD-metalloendopeptidase family protein [Tidjanibacter sp.]
MKKILLTILTLLASVAMAVGQSTIESLNAEIKRAEKEIAKNEKLLKEVVKSKKSNQTEIKLLQSKINNRDKIVGNLNKQIDLISKNIGQKEGDIASMNKQIERLKKEYAKTLEVAYKNYKVGSPLLFLFSARDLNTATQRLNFMQRYNKALKTKADNIEELSRTVAAEVEELGRQQASLDKTKGEHQRELATLTKERKQLSEAGKKLAANEKKISKQLKAEQAQKKKAQQALQRIIDEETRKAKRKMTDAERRAITELNGRFDQNKGKMLLPVDGGVIIEHFGTHQHPTQKHITVVNKGVNIAAPKGADVMAIFEGQVARVMFIAGLNNCVMLRHGDYFTIYSNLATVSVKAGESVRANQKLGSLSGGDNPDDYQLHFELWYHTTNQDPEVWFAK